MHKVVQGLNEAVAHARIEQLERILTELVTHFTVTAGANKDTNQYGHLELWWAARSVDEEGSALYNPRLLLGDAQNSYSLAAMGHLQGLLAEAKKALEPTTAPIRET